jgi:hypothetical protein
VTYKEFVVKLAPNGNDWKQCRRPNLSKLGVKKFAPNYEAFAASLALMDGTLIAERWLFHFTSRGAYPLKGQRGSRRVSDEIFERLSDVNGELIPVDVVVRVHDYIENGKPTPGMTAFELETLRQIGAAAARRSAARMTPAPSILQLGFAAGADGASR